VFPDGIFYNKKNDECRTENINQIFFTIASLSKTLSNKKTGITSLNMSYSSSVPSAGVEPARFPTGV
jgi:hypothetical protein